jgi:hypothetical protein
LDKIGYLGPKLKQSQQKAGNKNIKKNLRKTKNVNQQHPPDPLHPPKSKKAAGNYPAAPGKGILAGHNV